MTSLHTPAKHCRYGAAVVPCACAQLCVATSGRTGRDERGVLGQEVRYRCGCKWLRHLCTASSTGRLHKTHERRGSRVWELAGTKVTLHQTSYAWTGTITHAMHIYARAWACGWLLSLEV